MSAHKKAVQTLIVGGGIIGSGIAFALSQAGARDIAVLDCDLSGKWGSSERNAGGVRATWGEKINIALSRDSILFYESVAEEVAFQQKGYLWLHDEAAWDGALRRAAFQNAQGCPVAPLSPAQISRQFPFLDRLEGIAGATFSPKDGLINPNLLKDYYRRHSGEGVEWIDHQIVASVSAESGRVRQVGLQAVSSEAELVHFLGGNTVSADDDTQTVLEVECLINATGCWAPSLSRLCGQSLPTIALRRQVAVLHVQDIDLSDTGMIVDSSGLYFHPEAGHVLTGYAVPTETPGYCFDYDGEDYVMSEIWPRLAARSHFFDRLKPVGGWAGLYGLSPDRSAIVGAVAGFENFYEAHSFSGHGVMQSYAVGRALAELILEGRYHSLDLSVLSGSRFEKGQLVREQLDI